MDDATRARYKVWMRRRILRRIVMPGAIFLVLLVGVVIGLSFFGSDEDDIIYSNEVTEGDEFATEIESLAQPVSALPTYQDFDFSTYDEESIVEIGVDYLNSYLVLVNKVFRLPEDYLPEDLVLPEVLSAWGHDNTNHRMRETAARALEAMFGAARDEGLILWIASGYRSFEEQEYKHQYFIDTHGLEAAEVMSARPGHSEHQTGLVVDVTAASVSALLTEGFANEPEGMWLRENAHQFGFIVRYPYGRMSLTGVGYEPWHIRYVGVPEATYIFENDIVLEQYIFPVQRWEQP